MEASGLLEMGTHSHTHASFKRKPEVLQEDLWTSLALLTERLGPRPRPFAFPFGSVRGGFADANLVKAARQSGVTCSLTTEIELVDFKTSPFEWGRLEVIQTDSSAVVRAKVEGWYNWMTFTRESFRLLRRALSPG